MFKIEFKVTDNGFEPEFTDEDFENILDSVKNQIVNKVATEGEIRNIRQEVIGHWSFERDD